MHTYKISSELPAVEQQIFLRNLKESKLKDNLESALWDGDFFTTFGFCVSTKFNISLTREDSKQLYYRSCYFAPTKFLHTLFNNDERKAREYCKWFTDKIAGLTEYTNERKKIISIKKLLWENATKAFNDKGCVSSILLDFYELEVTIKAGTQNPQRTIKATIKAIKEMYSNIFNELNMEPVKVNIKVEEI